MKIEKILTIYKQSGSLLEAARAGECSPAKARKILITSGDYESPIAAYCESHTKDEAQTHFGCSKTTINNWLPYTKGVYDGTSATTIWRRKNG